MYDDLRAVAYALGQWPKLTVCRHMQYIRAYLIFKAKPLSIGVFGERQIKARGEARTLGRQTHPNHCRREAAAVGWG